MIEKYKRGGIGMVLVRMEHTHKVNTGIVGLNGQELVIGDHEYQKERNARTQATVIQTPLSIGRKPIGSKREGIPKYGPIRIPEADIDGINDAVYARPKTEYTWMSDIAPEVQVGDSIYFAWNQTFDGRNVIAKAKDGKSMILRIAYDTIHAVVRDGKIIPIGGNVLIDPIWENFDSTLRPTYYPFNGPDGKPAVRPKSEWIQVKLFEKHKDREGVIKYIGTPLKGQRCALKPGMRVMYKPVLQNLLDIEGGKYFVMRQDQILLYR